MFNKTQAWRENTNRRVKMAIISQPLETTINLFSNQLFGLFTVLSFFIFLYFLHKFLKENSTKKNLPPSPTKLPIIGNLHQIGRLAHRSLHKLSQKHGELMLLNFGNKPVIIVSSAKVACEIMKTHDTIFADRPLSSVYERLLYNGRDIASSPYGPYWKHVRSICVLQLLSFKKVQSFRKIREEEVAESIKEIESSPAAIDLSKILINFSSDVICRVAFGLKFHGKKDGIDFKKLMENHEELLGGFYVGEFIPCLAWIDYMNGVNIMIKRVARDMNRFLEGIVQEHVDRLSENRLSYQGNDDENTKDLVDVLLELQHESTGNFSLDRESIKAVILDMFVAGTTTTFASLEWIMSELLMNPRVMETLQKEVRGITKDKGTIEENDLEKMDYLKAVIKESFRLHHPVPLLLPRISIQGAKVNGYDIPARTQVIINAWAIHRDPSSWDEPDKFKPERFLNSPIDYKGQDFCLIPFGSGRRGCPGQYFAITNMELMLATLVDKFNWKLPGGKTLDMMEYPGLTIHRMNPLIVIATRYHA